MIHVFIIFFFMHGKLIKESIFYIKNNLIFRVLSEISILLCISAPSKYDCNFEQGLCTWSQAHDDQFDWTRKRGGTSSVGTGPSVDHTLGNSMYSPALL